MEDKKRKKEDKRKRDASQKVAEQKNKVPELTKSTSTQSPATPSSVTPSPGPPPSPSPSPASAPAGSPAQGGNNAKRAAVANGQPASGAQPPQRYMSREVPPRFRCQQDHKVLLKRGQPPLSCMLLGGGNGSSPTSQGDGPNATAAGPSDPSPGSLGPAPPNSPSSSSSSSVAAASSSNYANSTWGVSSGSQPPSQGWGEKVIVDGSDLEEWPSIAGGAGGDGVETGGASQNDRHLQQSLGAGAGAGEAGDTSSPSPPSSSSCSSNECMQPGGAVWGSAAAGSASSKSKVTPLPGPQEGALGVSGGFPGANFNPSANPSAWPALVQDETAVEGVGDVSAPEGNLASLQPPTPVPASPSPANSASRQHSCEMQARDREPPHGEWGGAALELGAGPKTAGDMDCGITGEDPSASSSSSSSWRLQSFSANAKTGGSRADAWEGGSGGPASTGEGTSTWSHEGKGGAAAGSAWAAGGGGSCKTSGVSQGAWGGVTGEELSVGEWGNSGGGMSLEGPGDAAGGSGDGGSSSNSSSGGSIGNPPDSASPTSTTMTRAWDNQTGVGEGRSGETVEWGGQGKGGTGASSSSGGSRSRTGGGPPGQHQHSHSHHRPAQQPTNPEVALQNLLRRTDLDPRVLSNVGWGQTQIRQNVAWDLEEGEERGSNGRGMGSSAFSSAANSTTNSSSHSASASSMTTDPLANLNRSANLTGTTPSGDGWEDSSTSGLSRGPSSSGSGGRNHGTSHSVSGSGVGGLGNPAGVQGKSSAGWSGVSPGEGQGKGWSTEGPEWREHRGGGAETAEWGAFRQQGTPAAGGWGGGPEEKGTSAWKEMGRDGGGGGWGQRGGSEWGERETKPERGVWGEGKGNGGNAAGDSKVGSWGNWDDGGSKRGWGGGGEMGGKGHQSWGSKPTHTQIPNSQAAVLKAQIQHQQQSQPQPPSLDTGAAQGGWGRPGGASSQNQNQSSGWTSGPMPQMPGEGPEPSGWEEPSPQSVSRRMEIDDGTSAWGDPSRYNKSVKLWDQNGAAATASPQAQVQQQIGQPTVHQPQQQQQLAGRPVHQTTGTGVREQGHGPGKPAAAAPAMWGGGTPGGPGVDNGTAAWGKAADTPTGWGDPEDSGKASGWGNPSTNSVKPGSKSMQEGWGDGEASVGASRHSSWEEEEEAGGMWNSAGSQGSSSSYNSGGWGQSHGGKKGNNKGTLKSGGGDSWMNPVTRQFSNMGLLGEDPSGRPLDLAPGPPQDRKLEGDKRGLSLGDYNGEMRKGGRGGAVFRSPSSKEVGPGEPGPYYDKDGCLGDEGPTSPFPSSAGFKPPPLYSHSNPPRQVGGHNVFGGNSGMGQSRGVHQPGVSPINPSPGIRAQVPHQFLTPQVPGSVLKQMPPPNNNMGGIGVGGVGGMAGGMFPTQLSPQHLAMLSSIYPQMQQFHLACQLLLQQQQQQQLLQNQRKFPQGLRQQPDPQQLARVMAILQQQRQQQQQQQAGVGTGSKLSPSHLGGGAPKQAMASDQLPHLGMVGSLADLHAKTQAGYSGFSAGANLSGLELGSIVGGPGNMKEGGGQQSRFKWMMEGHSPTPSPPDSTLHKNGPISAPVKLRGGSPYSQYELLGNENLGGPPQTSSDNWHRTPGSKIGTKAGTSSWPQEFQPGVPWKGIQSADPESDPYVTPGSVLGPSGPSSLSDSEHQLLRDNAGPNPSLNTLLPSTGAWPYSASDSPVNNAHSSAKYTDYKPSWPPDPIGHNKLWKSGRNSSQVPRPPPGLTNQKPQSPWSGGGPRLARGWGGTGGSQEMRYGPGSSWSDGGSSRGSCWLVLSNLTPQIDGSTLRTICMQHGPLLTFHLGLTQGSALIRYSTRQEAAKAQSALHMCVLGNTTILAEFVSEEEVTRYFAHSQGGGSGTGNGGGAVGTVPGSGVGQGQSGTTVTGASSGGSPPGGERERAGGGNGGGGGVGSVGTSGSGWQGLDDTGNSPDPSSAQGPGLSIFTQWSSNGAASGSGGVGVGMEAVDPGRAGLWGGMTQGYPSSSSLWGAPQMDDRHQMDSPASLLPGDLLGGGADSI
ncbi:trinucleotide repeat-containing gene 6B protein-like isoform X2 [Scleropages formosus]|uniref:Trinucleotide repeat-containing 6B protein-like n=1 Tax=Scleropages formosus TaxID=113540 RepID=A0A8C9V2T5_SCLFO|nr:trinucleotide repeat-containing gene 6B protein-like isoform X2 [Scleropages formosus]